MLIPVVLSPRIFNVEQLNDADQIKNIFILLDFLKKCKNRAIILFDKDNIIKTYIHDYIETIKSQEFKKNIKELLILLYKTNRIIEIDIKNKNAASELFEECNSVLLLALQEEFADIIFNKNTECSGKFKIPCFREFSNIDKNRVFDICNISQTELDEALERSSYSTAPNQISLKEFESKFMIPIFKYSRRLCVYDRQIVGEGRNGSAFELTSSYKKNFIHWAKLIQIINPNLEIEIFSAINSNQSSNQSLIKKKIDEFFSILQTDHGLNIKLKILTERKELDKQYSSLVHNRYIFTDTINFSCDRGLDIINSNNEVRDFHISLVVRDDAKAIKTYFESLQ